MSEWNDAIEAAAMQVDCGGKGRCNEMRLKDDSCLRYVCGHDCPHEQANEIRSLKRPADQDGWKLVPAEPTDEMLAAMHEAMFIGPVDENWPVVGYAGYHAILSAAPTPEAK